MVASEETRGIRRFIGCKRSLSKKPMASDSQKKKLVVKRGPVVGTLVWKKKKN